MKKEINNPGADRLHTWWELTYAQYLTVPRSVMQSMPDTWQYKMAVLLEELDERIDWRPEHGRYYCYLRADNGQFINDPLGDYERGRRRLPLKEKQKVRYARTVIKNHAGNVVFEGDPDEAFLWLKKQRIPDETYECTSTI